MRRERVFSIKPLKTNFEYFTLYSKIFIIIKFIDLYNIIIIYSNEGFSILIEKVEAELFFVEKWSEEVEQEQEENNFFQTLATHFQIKSIIS